jgi:hypothetical protein
MLPVAGPTGYRFRMINDHVLGRFGTLAPGLLKPIYADYAFANLASTIHYLLTREQLGPLLPADCFGGSYPSPRRIVLVFIDSFGWEVWQRYQDCSRITRAVVERGMLTPVSALFPSTTAASVTTLNLGCLPATHGVYEWNMYVPAYGETIQSLSFSLLGGEPGSAARQGHDVRDLVEPIETAHQRLARHGVRSIQLAHRGYARSLYNSVVSEGAEVIAHGSLPEALVHLRMVLEKVPEPCLVNLYWAGLDTAAHVFGPGTPVHDAEVRAFWATMDELLSGLDCRETLFLFTADHGHVHVPAGETLYINERWPELADSLAVSPTGRTIWPNGSPRDMFLHLKLDRRAATLAMLREKLRGVAEVLPVEEGLELGLFGPDGVGPTLRPRLGDVVILPHPGHFVWWREKGLLENRFHGHHGGLSPAELVSALGVVDSL